MTRARGQPYANLVQTWLDAGKARGASSHGASLRTLNATLGSRYHTSHLYRWRAGSLAVPEPVRLQMLAEALPWLVQDLGLAKPEAADELAQTLLQRLR